MKLESIQIVMKMKYHQIKYKKEYTISGIFSNYSAEIQHTGLKEKKILKDKDKSTLETKILNQFKRWDHKFEQEEGKNTAEVETQKAQANLKYLDDLLVFLININIPFSYESLLESDSFEKKNPKAELDIEISKLKPTSKPKLHKTPNEPLETDSEFSPKFTILEKLFPGLKRKKLIKIKAEFEKKHREWLNENTKLENDNTKLESSYLKQVEKLEKQKIETIKKYEKLISEWENEKKEYEAKIKAFNSQVLKRKMKYLEGEVNELIFYNSQIIKHIDFPKYIPNIFELHYNPENRILIIEYVLPSLEDLPKINEVRFLSTKNETKQVALSEPQTKVLYDKTIYNIILGIISLIFKSDIANSIDAININGWVNTIDKRIGRMVNSCIVSLQTSKKEFMEVNLKNVDPKMCFKNLKGVGSSSLSSLVAIQPILKIDKKDKRFVESKDVDFEETTNLALMDWGDFEHLIRELFEKEFATNGGEVKVTQASRDGGVDAIAFDPDPIRGGKIIIQAKRYTNVVGVSAVRDLYGTVHNEGANKGILVTTSEYGADSYEFAKDKPLTLLNGSNLLHLLLKHGQKARIDIKEAKKIIKEQEGKNNYAG